MAKFQDIRLVGLFFMFLPLLCGQTESKFNLTVEPVWMGLRGNDVHFADVVDFKRNVEEFPIVNFDYGASYTPLRVIMENKAVAIITIEKQHNNKGGFGISGWSFDTIASNRGEVESPANQSPNSKSLRTVRMFDHTLVPLPNQREKSLVSPIQYQAVNRLKVWQADVYGFFDAIKNPGYDLKLLGGVKFAGLSNNRQESFRENAFLFNLFGNGLHFDNRVNLSASSDTDYHVTTGPMLGFRFEARRAKWSVSANVKGALLFGNGYQRGIWIDTDNIWAVDDQFKRVVEYGHFRGEYPFSKQERAAVKTTDMSLRVAYALHKNMNVGLSFVNSIWHDVELASKWSMPGLWTDVGGTNWRNQRSTLVFRGIGLSMGFHF